MLCCVPGFDSTKLRIFEVLLFSRLRGMKVETDTASHRLMTITNASYDVCKITVNKMQIEREMSNNPSPVFEF